MITSERSPVFSLLSFSMAAMTALRALAACSPAIPGFHRAVDARGHVLDRHQHVELEIDAFLLFGLRFRVKAVAKIIMLLVSEFLKTIRADVMVGDAQVHSRKQTSRCRRN